MSPASHPVDNGPSTQSDGAAAEELDNVTPAPDLIAAATQAASQALGWTSPEAVLASTLVVPAAPPPSSRRPARKAPASKAPAPLPAAVAIRLPPLPAYHSAKMELRAEIDRGEVVLARPKLDKDGHKMWHPPVSDRPTLTLYARVGKGEVALGRWPTTIGGWKTIEKSDGSMALKYKESVTGDAIWPEILATPTWHPATGIPTRKLLIKRGDTWSRRPRSSARATARPTGWWRWCTTRSRVLTSTANRSSWTTVSGPTAHPPTDQSSAARATAATGCTTTWSCAWRASW